MADVEEPVLQASVTRLRQQEYDVLGVVTDVSSGASVEAPPGRFSAAGSRHLSPSESRKKNGAEARKSR